MKLRTLITVGAILSLFVSVAPAFAALPTVNTFTVPATATSPVPVSAFTASDSDGTVVGYMITQTSAKPAAADSRWTATPWSSFTTTSIGALTLYAWAKDNANGVSNSRTTATNVVGTHEHTMAQVTGLTAALAGKADIDHNHDAVYQKKYANVVVVAKSGGDFTDPIAAINSIVDASATNPYLIKIMPGVYDLGSSALLMKQFVDIEGAGENSTVITSSVICISPYYLGTVNVTGNAELRFLTVRNAGTGAVGRAISSAGQPMKLLHVTATASGATEECYGISCAYGDLTDVTASASGGNYSFGIASGSCNMTNVTTTATGSAVTNTGLQIGYASPTMNNVSASASGSASCIGIHNLGSSPVMNNVIASGSGGGTSWGIRNIYESSPIMANVTATASGEANNYGIEFYGSPSPVMSNVTATGRNGTWNSGLAISGAPGTLLIDRSTFEGSTGSIEIYTAYDLRIGASKLVGGIIGGGGTLTCVASYNGNYAPLGANCQ